jgi:hypothetical protein
MSDSPPPSTTSEDELARAMIERISREVDLETGRKPIETDEPGEESVSEAAPPAEEADVDEAPPEERSEEDVTRDLVERIAREVDEETHG